MGGDRRLAPAASCRLAPDCSPFAARYKNVAAHCAVALEIEVERESGRIAVTRAVAAVDSGEAVNPDGIRNQIEGAIIQSLSWTTREQVRFDAAHRTSFDWSTYPILRFEDQRRRSKCTSLIGLESLSLAPERRAKAWPLPPSPMRSPMPPAEGYGTCGSAQRK
jgi:xanthine dehydrogenase molybdopterin-binding subunit B